MGRVVCVCVCVREGGGGGGLGQQHPARCAEWLRQGGYTHTNTDAPPCSSGGAPRPPPAPQTPAWTDQPPRQPPSHSCRAGAQVAGWQGRPGVRCAHSERLCIHRSLSLRSRQRAACQRLPSLPQGSAPLCPLGTHLVSSTWNCTARCSISRRRPARKAGKGQ